MKIRIVAAYIPALHRGYIDFFKKYSDAVALYVLNHDLVREFNDFHLERDIRAIPTEEMIRIIRATSYFLFVGSVGHKNLKNWKKDVEIIMPDEDISHAVAEKYLRKYLRKKKIVFDNTLFLRWDKNRSILEQEVPSDRTIDKEGLIKEMFDRVEEESEKSSDWWRHVGAVAARDNKILFAAHNRHFPFPQAPNFFGDPRSNFNAGEYIDRTTAIHAEAGLVAQAARQGVSLENCDMYASVFPCPACAKSLAIAGIKRLYFEKGYSILDSVDILRQAGVETIRVKQKPQP